MVSNLSYLRSGERRIFTLLFFLLISLQQYGQDYKGYNILFVAFDDLRPEIGAYGVPDPITPNIDRVAAEGTRFDRAYVNYPVCLPSRASMLTGVRFNNKELPNGSREFNDMIAVQDTWPRTLKNAGYWTAVSGKVYHGDPPNIDLAAWDIPGDKWKTERDFSSYIMSRVVDEGGRDGHIEEFRETGNGLGLLVYQSIDGPDDLLNDGITANEAVDFIKNGRDPGKPFLICAGFNRPHLPWLAPKKYYDMYPEDIGTMAYLPVGEPKIIKPYDETEKNSGLWNEGVSDSIAKRLIRAYMACTTYADAQLGRLLNTLEEEGLEDSTIVVLWGDHGYHLTDHGLWRKNTQYQQAMRCPLIIKVPGLTKGDATENIAQNIDIYPTLLDLLGLSPDLQLQGRSLLPLLENPDTSWINETFTCSKWKHGLITDRYRFTDMNDGTFLLFDLQEDPHEWTNLADLPEYQGLVNTFSEKLSNVTWNVASNGNYSYLHEKVSLQEQDSIISSSKNYTIRVYYESPVSREIYVKLLDSENHVLGQGKALVEPGIETHEIDLACTSPPALGASYKLSTDIRPAESGVEEAFDSDTLRIEIVSPADVSFQLTNSSTGNPVQGAEVFFGDLILYTDINGYAYINDVYLDFYEIEVRCNHYDTISSSTINIRSDTLIALELKPEIYELDIQVKELASKIDIPFAEIVLNGNVYIADIFGSLKLEHEYGDYTLQISLPNFEDLQQNIQIETDTSILLLPRRIAANVEFRIYHQLNGIEGARITIGEEQKLSDRYGKVEFPGLMIDTNLVYRVDSDEFSSLEDSLLLDSDSLVIVRLTPLGTETLSLPSTLKMYPNPASDFLILEGVEANEVLEFIALDGSNRVQMTGIWNGKSIDISALSPGLYCLKDRSGKIMGKVLIK